METSYMGTEATRSEIEAAISRILQGTPKRVASERRLCISAVAEEAAVSNATIHNRYPDLAVRIRTIMKHGIEAEALAQSEEIANLRRALAQSRQALRGRDDEIRHLKAVNLLLAREIQALREDLESLRSSCTG